MPLLHHLTYTFSHATTQDNTVAVKEREGRTVAAMRWESLPFPWRHLKLLGCVHGLFVQGGGGKLEQGEYEYDLSSTMEVGVQVMLCEIRELECARTSSQWRGSDAQGT